MRKRRGIRMRKESNNKDELEEHEKRRRIKMREEKSIRNKRRIESERIGT
jgi:hypothetical protein